MSKPTNPQSVNYDYKPMIQKTEPKNIQSTGVTPIYRKMTIRSISTIQVQMPQVKDERSLTTPDEANISQHELSRIPKPVDKTIENSHDVYDIQMHPESEQYENRLFEFVNSNRYPRRTYL